MTDLPPLADVNWPQSYRIIASRYPPIALFEDVTADPAALDALIALEQLTNPRVRDEIGNIALVPPEDRVTGPGASWVMAAFTHVNSAGSRFSDGTYGVYYAGQTLDIAIRETAWHFARIACASDDGPRREDMRVLVSSVDCTLHDVTPDDRDVLDPDDYSAGQALGRSIRAVDGPGVHYPSVRAEGSCVGIFRAPLVPVPMQERHLQFAYDGARVSRYFDYETDLWFGLD
ncbi:MAG: RES family NAD+ phosphorylase [Pseudomonadota bacterium]